MLDDASLSPALSSVLCRQKPLALWKQSALPRSRFTPFTPPPPRPVIDPPFPCCSPARRSRVGTIASPISLICLRVSLLPYCRPYTPGVFPCFFAAFGPACLAAFFCCSSLSRPRLRARRLVSSGGGDSGSGHTRRWAGGRGSVDRCSWAKSMAVQRAIRGSAKQSHARTFRHISQLGNAAACACVTAPSLGFSPACKNNALRAPDSHPRPLAF